MKKTKYVLTLIAGVALALTSTTSRAADDETKKGSGFIGKITAMDADAKTVTVEQKKDDTAVVYTLTEETKLVGDDGEEVEMSAMVVGTKVRVMTDEGATEAKKIKIVPTKTAKDDIDE